MTKNSFVGEITFKFIEINILMHRIVLYTEKTAKNMLDTTKLPEVSLRMNFSSSTGSSTEVWDILNVEKPYLAFLEENYSIVVLRFWILNQCPRNQNYQAREA